MADKEESDVMKKNVWTLLMILILVLPLAACGGKAPDAGEEAAAGAEAEQAQETGEDELGSARVERQAAEEVEEAQPSPTSEPTGEPEPSPEPEIAHLVIPGDAEGSDTFVTDINSAESEIENSTVGDYFPMNRLERPFTANEMDYVGDLDITRVDLRHEQPWFYATFTLAGNLRESADIHYGLELDLDADGRGEYLVWAALPGSGEWTTDGVQVLQDLDGDVGGIYPLYIEEPNPELTGYEALVFDQGRGEDPDLAWVRRDPEDDARLQIAFKEDVPGPLGFLWSAWADGALMNPALFDYNDQYTEEQAGSPNKGNPGYPIKSVFLADSTCRSWYGMTPTGDEPGLCSSLQASETSDGGPGTKMGFCHRSVLANICAGPCLPTCTNPPCLACTLP
jgi:predicted small lipoprotein YifL